MQKDLNIKKIQAKFHELIQLDQNRKGEEQEGRGEIFSSILSGNSKSSQPQKEQKATADLKKTGNEGDQLIFTKSDICREVAKLKPYLRNFGETQTSVQMEDRNNKRISDAEQNSLSELVIYLNKQLCEQLRGIDEDQSQNMRRQNREKEGWVYEVFYRFADSEQAPQLNQTTFKNGYVVLTQILELFPNLTFQQSLLRVNINQIKRVKYMQEREYQVMDIRFHQGTLHVAFLNETQMKLFDRMLFLLKNMARTSSTRLFQNQLLKNIYSEY